MLISIYLSLFKCFTIYLYIYLVYLSLSISIYLSLSIFLYLSLSIFLYLSFSIYLSLSIFLYLSFSIYLVKLTYNSHSLILLSNSKIRWCDLTPRIKIMDGTQFSSAIFCFGLVNSINTYLRINILALNWLPLPYKISPWLVYI